MHDCRDGDGAVSATFGGSFHNGGRSCSSAQSKENAMEVRCRIIYDKLKREECVLAAIPRVGETIVLGIGGTEFRVDQVTHVANRRDGLDPHAIIYTTKVDHSARS